MVSTRLLVLGAVALSTTAHPTNATMAGPLDEAFATAVREKRIPGIAAVALNRDGSVIYKNSWGTINIDDPSSAPVTSTTRMEIASMLKALVTVAALQLVEQRKLCLDDLVEDHIPSWKNISVLDGFSADGEPILRPPKTKATVLQLFTHTSGAGYFFLSKNLTRFNHWAGKPPQFGADPLHPEPLVADPGTGWFYGTSIDYLSHIISAISGIPINTYLDQHILEPLGIQNSDLPSIADMHAHRRLPNGTIISSPPTATTAPISTLDDYATFLLALINHGTHPTLGTTILQPSTVKQYLFTDLIPATLTSPSERPPAIGVIQSVNPTQSNDGEFLLGTPKGWSASFLLNNEEVQGGRSKGSGAWGGIYNLYYWVDLEAGKLGVVFTNLLPFLDPVTLELFGKLEGFAYS